MTNPNKKESLIVSEFNEKYQIGTKVLFQPDNSENVVITKTRSKAQIMCNEPVIFLEGVSGCYSLSPDFVRVLTNENKNLKKLR